MRADHEVALFRDDAMHRRDGQVEPQRLPRGAVVERYIDTVLGADVEQAAALDIFTDRARKIRVGDAADDLLPRFAEVRGFIDVRLAIALLIAVRDEIRDAVLVRRR